MYEMMNRSSSKDLLTGAAGRNHNHNHNSNNHSAMSTGILPHRRGMPFNKNNGNAAENFDNNTDLFSRNRTSLPAASSDETDLQVRLARLSVGSAKPAKNILDDLLSSNEGGKNDYDWLLTPPGTPLFPSSDGKDSQPTPVTARSKSSVRSSSLNKTSRFQLSVSQSESSYPSRPTRSNSVTRSTTQYTTTNYSNNRNTNLLNTSSASVSSYIRPSTPTNRSSTRPSTPTNRSSTRPSTRTTPSRGSTPSRTRPVSTTNSTDRSTTKPAQSTRPSTPSSRPQTPGNLNSNSNSNSPNVRPVSRPSTPTRRTPTPSIARSVGSTTSRPSSPSPRVRTPPQQINHPDFSHETPPNLRTTLPDRPLSASRSRPVSKGSLENSSSGGGNITRRHSSPIVNRGRAHGNGHAVDSLEPRRSSNLPESLARKPVKSLGSENGAGFGRNISKKSLDMAIKHMDIRNGGTRAISGSTLFPQSIRSTTARTQPGRSMSTPGSVDGSNHGHASENGYSWNRGLQLEDQSPHSSKLSSEVDIYESSAILLKEDMKNTSWLHSVDDRMDDGLLFDNGFESLPEPF